jgi:parallel beta-helix repeat protein
MTTYLLSRSVSRYAVGMKSFLGVLGLMVVLIGCNSGGDSGSISPQSAEVSPPLEQAAVRNLLDLYRTALRQEDIDRLQSLLTTDGGAFGGQSFLEAMSASFREEAVTDVELTEVAMPTTNAPATVSFRETVSVEAPNTLKQRTHSQQTTWQLVKQTAASGAVTILIGAVTHVGPRFEITSRGQVQAGVPTAVEVRETSGMFGISGVEVEVPEMGTRTTLADEDNLFRGHFTPLVLSHPQALRVHIRDRQGAEVVIGHRYRLRLPREGAVEIVADTGAVPFFAVATAPNGTVWAGGEAETAEAVGTLIQVSPDGRALLRSEQPGLGLLPVGAEARIEDLAIDQLGRVHALFIARAGDRARGGNTAVVGNGDVVLDPNHPDLICQTVNIRDTAYPFRMPDPQTDKPLPSARVVPAGGGDIWLFGSDGGVAQVADTFREGQCAQGQAQVRYDPVFRRGESGLLSNTVPALVVGRDGALWFGTARGVTRLKDGQFTPVPFNPTQSLPVKVETLEGFFQAVAQAIFDARPVSTVRIGDVSFAAAFGGPLVKEDLIFSAVEDGQGGVWLGTLGGGIRRIEVRGGAPQETRHLTRQDGLGSNIILAIAAGPDGSIWAATDEGVSRIQENNGAITITNFSAVDGLQVPVQDVAVGGDGTVWLATTGGLFRLTTTVGLLRGVVREATGRPVAGGIIRVLGTRFHTVTDAEGRFVLGNLPPGAYQLLIDGSVVAGGPFTATVVEVTLGAEERQIEPVVVLPRPRAARLVARGGDGQTGAAGQPLRDPLAVAAQDEEGRGIAGVPVAFRVAEGRGLLNPEVVITDASGVAATSATVTSAGTLRVAASADGLAPVVFNLTGVGEGGCQTVKPRLIPISGNNQSAQPEQLFPEPLVVQLEDQFGRPIAGHPVSAEVTRGPGTLTGSGTMAVAITDVSGRASFQLQAGASEQDIVVRVSAPELPQVVPVQFLAIVGAVDTPDLPLDLAVAGKIVYIADRFSGVQIIDASNPENPVRLDAQDLAGSEVRLTLEGNWLYVATTFPPRLYILDTVNPSTPVVHGSVDLPAQLQTHGITGVAVQGGFAYVVTDARIQNSGTLQVVNIDDPAKPITVGNVSYDGRPVDLAVSGNFGYVPAGADGLMIFNLSNPANPVLASRLKGTFTSGIALAGGLGYTVELSPTENRFTVLDLTTPAAPRPLRAVQTRLGSTGRIAIAGRFAYLVQFTFGLQAIDISNPVDPRVLGNIDTPSVALNIAAIGTSIYVTDQIFGLQVILGPGSTPETLCDPDRDGIINFFDAFNNDPTEWQDTDGDGIGDNADRDDDNDGFTDEEERQADPLTDPKAPHIFPVRLPPQNTTTLVVDAASPLPPRERNGTPEAPYRSISEAMRAIHALKAKGVSVRTLFVRAGTYSPLTTSEIFPLDLSGLSHLTLQGSGSEVTVIDTAFTADIMSSTSNTGLIIEGFTLTHGSHGILLNGATSVTIRRNNILDNVFDGIAMGINSNIGNIITENVLSKNDLHGIVLFERAAALIADNIFLDNGVAGIFVSAGSSAEIMSNAIENNKGSGIAVEGTSKAIVMNNMIHENLGNGILIGLGSAVTVRDSLIRDNTGAGISASGSGAVAEIIANTILGNKGDGIETDGSLKATVMNNMIHENLGNGIMVGLSSAVTVTDNLINDNTGAGILVSGALLAEIITNAIAGNNGNGIQVFFTPSATIRDNTIRENSGDGIFIPGNSRAEVTANAIAGNNGNGIQVAFISSATIRDNTIRENNGDGILVRGTSNVIISGGAISQNAGDGVSLVGASTAIIGQEGDSLTLSHNGRAGIFVTTDGSSAQINRSHIVFENNRSGDTIGPITEATNNDIAIDANNNLVVLDGSLDERGLKAVVWVDTLTGSRTIMSDAAIGRGPSFENPLGIAAEPGRNLVVVDAGLAAVVRVDPMTGDRTPVSGGHIGHGPAFISPAAIAVEADGSFAVVDVGLAGVVRVDPMTGDRTLVSGGRIGHGPAFISPAAIAVEANGNLAVVDLGLTALVRVDPITGDRTLVSGGHFGHGPALASPASIAVEPNGNLVLADPGLAAVVRVDPVTGDRTLVSGGSKGRGSHFLGPSGIAVETDGSLVVLDGIFGSKVVLRVDPISGDRIIISK